MNATTQTFTAITYDTPCPVCTWYGDMVTMENCPNGEPITVCMDCANDLDDQWSNL